VPQRNLREQLIEGGSRVLIERGYHASSVNDIVKAANVPKGSFYNHFESKEALALETTDRYVASYGLERLAGGDGPPMSRLRESFQSIVDRLVDEGVERGCLLGNFSTELAGHSDAISARVATALENWSAVVTAVLDQAQAAGELDPSLDTAALGTYIVGAYEGAVGRAKLTRDRAPLDVFMTTTFDRLLA